jgi:hypothetical protein
MYDPDSDTDSDTDSDATPINAVPISQQLNDFGNQLSSINTAVDQSNRNRQYGVLPSFFPILTNYKDQIISLKDSPTITGEEKTRAINLIAYYIKLRDKIDNILKNRLGVDGMPLRGGKRSKRRKSDKRKRRKSIKKKSIRKKSIRRK